MIKRIAIQRVAALAIVVWATPAAWGDDKGKTPQRSDGARQMWDVGKLLQGHCDGLARHYKLDASQKSQAAQLVAERTNKFLEMHDQDIWPLLIDLTRHAQAGNTPDAQEAKRIAAKGYPVFLNAKAEILEAQGAFRKILTADQQKIHDRDLKGMDSYFNVLDRRFQDWKQGQVAGRPLLRHIRVGDGQRLIPARPSAGDLQHETQWQRYVRQFIQDYALDPEQKARALAMLRDVEDKAAGYRQANQRELQEAEQYYASTVSASGVGSREIGEAKMIWDLMTKPLDDLFVELQRRLQALPTEKQKAGYYQRNPSRKPSRAQPQQTAPGTGPPAGVGTATG